MRSWSILKFKQEYIFNGKTTTKNLRLIVTTVNINDLLLDLILFVLCYVYLIRKNMRPKKHANARIVGGKECYCLAHGIANIVTIPSAGSYLFVLIGIQEV